MIMYRLREAGHMDPVLNGQLIGKAKNGSTNVSAVSRTKKHTYKLLHLNDQFN